MSFLGWRRWPTPACIFLKPVFIIANPGVKFQIVKPLWPFFVAAGIVSYGVAKLQYTAVRCPSRLCRFIFNVFMTLYST
jgi:hypothetical protein